MASIPQIFLSYGRSDQERVEELYRKLSAEGFRPWMDKRNILPGEAWKSKIEEEIRHSDFFLACLSARAIDKRGLLQMEIKIALEIWKEMLSRDIYLIPVRLEDCDIPEILHDIQWVDLFDEDGWSLLLQAIRAGIERRRKGADSFLTQSANDRASRIERTVQGNALGTSTTQGFSVSGWVEVLTRRMHDGRHVVRAQSGGIVEFVESELRKPENNSLLLHLALHNLVDAWRPQQSASEAYLIDMFDLISAFTPPRGFSQVIFFLRHALSEETTTQSRGMKTVSPDTVLKGLAVLDKYFPIPPLPPANSTPAFNAYVSILRDCVAHSAFCSYAIGKLIELEVLDISDKEVVDLIQTYPGALQEITGLALRATRPLRIAQNLSELYAHCLAKGYDGAMDFERILGGHKARLEHRENGPAVCLASNELVGLDIPVNALAQYMIVRWKLGEGDSDNAP